MADFEQVLSCAAAQVVWREEPAARTLLCLVQCVPSAVTTNLHWAGAASNRLCASHSLAGYHYLVQAPTQETGTCGA